MHLIPEKPTAWEELPRRNRRWRVLKNWALKPGVLRVSELWTLEAERPLGAAAAGAPRLVKCKCPWPVSVVKTVLTNSSATQLRTVELGLELELGHKFRKDKIKEFRLT